MVFVIILNILKQLVREYNKNTITSHGESEEN